MENNTTTGTVPYNVNSESKCPFSGATPVKKTSAGNGTSTRDWWPNQLKLNILRQHSALSNPMESRSAMQRNSKPSTWMQLRKIYLI